MTYILAEDAVGSVKRTIYARKGDEVKLVADYGNVAIVEDVNGGRFSTLKTNLKNQDESPNQTTQAPNQDNSGERDILGRDSSARKKGTGKAATNTPIIQPNQTALW